MGEILNLLTKLRYVPPVLINWKKPKKVYTKQELIVFLKKAAYKSKTTPKSTHAYRKKYGIPAHKYYLQKFGSWENALQEAGLQR